MSLADGEAAVDDWALSTISLRLSAWRIGLLGAYFGRWSQGTFLRGSLPSLIGRVSKAESDACVSERVKLEAENELKKANLEVERLEESLEAAESSLKHAREMSELRGSELNAWQSRGALQEKLAKMRGVAVGPALFEAHAEAWKELRRISNVGDGEDLEVCNRMRHTPT